MNERKTKETSFHENISEDELDLKALLVALLSNKLIITFFFCLSIPIALLFIFFTPPQYKAEALISIPTENETVSNNSGDMSLISALLGRRGNQKSDINYVLRSNAFLKTVISDNNEIDISLLESLPQFGSSFKIFDMQFHLGLNKIKMPTEEQKLLHSYNCLNKLFKVENFETTNGEKTSAIRIVAETFDPNFSANLVNQIIEKYIDWKRIEKILISIKQKIF